jgi:hypothetical protein
VLLAVLAAAGLLALAPALVRRYDATERLVAERALSTARVVTKAGTGKRRRRRTVPGRRPVNPPTWLDRAPAAARPAVSRHQVAARGRGSGRRPVTRSMPAVYRRRRVLLALVLLNAAESVGIALVGPGFWIGLAVSGTLLIAYLVHLRARAVVEADQRRARARQAARIARRDAERQARYEARVAARREALRRAAAARALAQRDAQRLSQRYVDAESSRRRTSGAVRGRPYSAGGHRVAGL